MAKPEDLPHLLLLLDDDSAVVQAEVKQALNTLIPELRRLSPELEPGQKSRINHFLEPAARARLLEAWPQRELQSGDLAQLEFGLDCIAQYQNGLLYEDNLSLLIDKLASEFRTEFEQASDPIELSNFLFKSGRIQGNTAKYYDPINSNLTHVIRSGRGNPISLTCVYILVAARLGMAVEGCNFPGHFLARAKIGDEIRYVDAFHSGEVLGEQLTDTLRRRAQGTPIEEILSKAATAHTILMRMLRNLHNGYRMLEQSESAELFLYLLKSSEDSELAVPDFSTGQLVEHRRYGYRGVVVDYDLKCKADDDWYRSNRTQPDREQPWYRVLVDDSDRITYAAQSSLKADTRSSRVKHPLIDVFFSGFDGDCYARNATPWPRSRP